MAGTQSPFFGVSRTPRPRFFLLAVAASFAGLGWQPALAQRTVAGYITAIHPPSAFEVDGTRVTVSSGTSFGMQEDTSFLSEYPPGQTLQVGAYVYVTGSPNSLAVNRVAAEVILFRDDLKQKLTGSGVIYRVISSGLNPVFEAGGYIIQTTAATQVIFKGDLKSLAGVSTNDWVHYEGKRNKNGVLVATKAVFMPAKPSKIKTVKGFENVDLHFQSPGSAPGPSSASSSAPPTPASASPTGSASSPSSAPQSAPDVKNSEVQANVSAGQPAGAVGDGSIKLGLFRSKVPADSALQSRISRIGMSLVPAYQKELAKDDPSKIDFRFYAVDDKRLRSEFCSLDGVVLMPIQMLPRLKSDDQLAAVLADGIAYNLQRESVRTIEENRAILGSELAGDILNSFVPGAGLIYLPVAIAAGRMEQPMEEERGRIALALMKDAGYDPWSAPEAWRLLSSKHEPSDPNLLSYTSLGAYQMSVLRLQYGQNPTPASAQAGAHQ